MSESPALHPATYLTVKDLARHLHIKPATLYAWAAQGKIPCVKIHGLVRFRWDEIERWLEGFRMHEPTPVLKSRTRSRSVDLDRLIASARREVYTARHGETRPTASPTGKEGLWGS